VKTEKEIETEIENIHKVRTTTPDQIIESEAIGMVYALEWVLGNRKVLMK